MCTILKSKRKEKPTHINFCDTTNVFWKDFLFFFLEQQKASQLPHGACFNHALKL